MTLARRVARLETDRTIKELVLGWLAEAQAYPTLPDYLVSLLDAPDAAWPLYRIAYGVEDAVRARAKGPEDEVWQTVRRSVGDAYFLFGLILRLNLDARAVCNYEGLRWALLAQWRAALSLQAELKRRTKRSELEGDHVILDADDWRTTLGLSLTALYVEEAARTSLEQKFFQGRAVLFPPWNGSGPISSHGWSHSRRRPTMHLTSRQARHLRSVSTRFVRRHVMVLRRGWATSSRWPGRRRSR